MFTLRSPDSVGRTARSRGSTAARPEPSLPPESAQSRPDSAALPRGARPHASRHLASRSSPPIPGCGSSEAQALRAPLSRRRGISSLRSSEQRLQYVQVAPYREREQHAGQTLEVVELGHVGRLHAGHGQLLVARVLRGGPAVEHLPAVALHVEMVDAAESALEAHDRPLVIEPVVEQLPFEVAAVNLAHASLQSGPGCLRARYLE